MAIQEKTKIEDALQELVKLDYDAIEAYEAAITRLDAQHLKDRMADYCEDHRRHVDNLGAELRRMNADVPTGPDAKRVLTEGKVIIADLGGDKAILKAMKANEQVTNKSYEKAVEHVDAGPELKSLLASNLEDERHHRAWIDSEIERM